VVTSVATLQGGQLVPRSPTTWIGRQVELDLNEKTAVLDLGPGKARRCSVGRSAAQDEPDSRGLGAPRAGLSPPGPRAFLAIECRGRSQRYTEVVDIIGESAIALVGDDKYLLILKRQAKARAARKLARDAACGEPGDRCATGQVCTATREPNQALTERCRDIEEP
jgi:hypothetical protein